MHKDEFYAILPKDANTIKCTVEVFKKKLAKYRSNPRTVLFQGREDDVTSCVIAKSMVNNTNQRRTEKYVIPAKRNEKKKQKEATIVRKGNQEIELRENFVHCGKMAKHISIGHVQLVAAEEVDPQLRTPCMQTHLHERVRE